MSRQKTIRGRCVRASETETEIRNESGLHSVKVTETQGLIGNLIEVDLDQQSARILTPNRLGGATPWTERVLDPRRLHGVAMRSKVESAIREFFLNQDFREVRTPLLVPCPGMEPHIRPYATSGGAYLPTSPEFAMKRLLVGGLERIFQICPAFRLEPYSTTHHPEFTMLEWYRAYSDYEQIMRDTEQLFEFAARKIFGKPSITFQGREISLAAPWPRLRVRDLFLDWCGVDLVACSKLSALRRECTRLGLSYQDEDTWDDLYFRIWLNLIEPKLPEDRAVFVTRYPRSQAALSVIDQDEDGSEWARRFEVYAGGIELGNAFDELTDPVAQRKRFVEDMELRERVYGSSFPKNPLDEGFLEALAEGMPPSGGIAMGVDRMIMLFADEPDIAYTHWLESYLEN